MKPVQNLISSLLILHLAGIPLAGFAESQSDLAKEKRWEEQIVDNLLVGEAVRLKSPDADFLALYAPPVTDKARGAVIIIHGMGVHPAWPEVINPLRMQLPELGWHTLSLQMPVLANDAKHRDYVALFPEVPARIQAGVDFLKQKGINNIVITGHSMGATMASAYLAEIHDPAVKIFAIISGGRGETDHDNTHILGNLKKIHDINIVDVFGSADHPYVVENLRKRKAFMRKTHYPNYSSLRIQDANHFYQDQQDRLVEKLHIKLVKLANTK